MTFGEIKERVRSLTRDFNHAVFRDEDVKAYINEGIDRCKHTISNLEGMSHLINDTDVPSHLPANYHYLLALYASSRLFAQDERSYQAATYMNEFEAKMEELLSKIELGEILIKDNEGNIIPYDVYVDYIRYTGGCC